MLKIGATEIDLHNKKIKVNGKSIELSIKEFEVLKYLAENEGKVITREELLKKVWGYSEYIGDIRSADVTISRIRDKIEDVPHNPKIILSKKGIGYYINTEKELVTPTVKNIADPNEEKITLWNSEITINNKYIPYYKLKQQFEQKAQRVKEYVIKSMTEIDYDNVFQLTRGITNRCEADIKLIIKELVEKNVYTETMESFKNCGYIKLKRAIEELVKKQNELDSQAARELESECNAEYRRLNRYNVWDYSIFGPMPGEKKQKLLEYIKNKSEYRINNMKNKTLNYFKSKTYEDLIASIEMFYDELCDDYVTKLYKVNEIVYKPFLTDYSTETMFENLEIIDDKKKILIEILRKNPRKKKAYMYIIKNGLFDKEVLNLAKKVCLDKEIKKELQNEITYKNNRNLKYIKALALLQNRNENEVIGEIQEKDEEKRQAQLKIEEQKAEERKIKARSDKIENTIKTVFETITIIGFIIFIMGAIN